jgi:Protein of unknown function (DUF2510)
MRVCRLGSGFAASTEGDSVEASPEAARQYPAGWYDFNGGKRYWDGETWTDHLAYVPLASAPVSYVWITVAVAVGMVIGWFLIWAGAQAAPDTFYWPVKFVVKAAASVNVLGQ